MLLKAVSLWVFASLIEATLLSSRLSQETAMKFGGLRAAVVGERSHFRSRNRLARRPGLESLEQRRAAGDFDSGPCAVPRLDIHGLSRESFGPPGVLISGQTFAGGDYLGSLNSTTAVSTYSLDDEARGGRLQRTHPRDVRRDSDQRRHRVRDAVPNAGAIAWLLTNIGPTAHTVDAQSALQAVIWRARVRAEQLPTGRRRQQCQRRHSE